MSPSFQLLFTKVLSLFRPINVDELVKEEQPKVEVLIIRQMDSELETTVLEHGQEVKVESDGKVYIKKSGRWYYDETIHDVEIIRQYH